MQNQTIDRSQVHDFMEENYSILVFSGFILPRKPKWFFILNLLRLATIYIIFLYLIVMAIITMTFPFDNKETPVMVFQTLCLIFAAIVQPLTRSVTDKSLQSARISILKGVYNYPEEDEEHVHIRKKQVRTIRLLITILTRLIRATAVTNTILMPIIQYFTITEDTSERILNPYLPLPIYMPFDTRTFLGYSVAFISNGTVWLVLANSSPSVIQIYLSSAFQLIAQMKILMSSMKNIEARAMKKLMKSNYYINKKQSNEQLHDLPEFQKCLVLCLRESIIHHQAILRLKKDIDSFIEMLNGLLVFLFVLILASTSILILENPSINIALAATVASDVLSYFQMCALGQMVTDTNEEMRNSLYETSWYNYSKEFKILLKTMLLYAQKPMFFRANGINIKISLESYGDMITAAYKMMNVLKEY